MDLLDHVVLGRTEMGPTGALLGSGGWPHLSRGSEALSSAGTIRSAV